MVAIDAEQREELESMIRELEEENKTLQAEYDRLRASQRSRQGVGPFSSLDDSYAQVGVISLICFLSLPSVITNDLAYQVKINL